MPIGNPHATFEQDEAFRQSVIRKALLLGFSCEERLENVGAGMMVQRFSFRRFNEELRMTQLYTGYASIYAAAYEYLRLMKVPHEVIGDYRG